MKIKNTALFIIILLLSITAFSQEKKQEKWLVNDWKVSYAVVDGKKEMPDKNDGILFKKDYTALLFQEGEQMKGKWKYLPEKKIIELTIPAVGIKTKLKVTKLTAAEFVYETKYNDGPSFTYYLIAAPKK